jgi:hypothetical protein
VIAGNPHPQLLTIAIKGLLALLMLLGVLVGLSNDPQQYETVELAGPTRLVDQ